MFVHGRGFMHLHFKLSLIIGDTEGHDKLCGHYCSYSSNIQRMCRDCNIPQCDGDDPHYPCQFVDAEPIKTALRECIPIINREERGNVANARERLSGISQLPIWSPLYNCDFCGCRHGIFGSCPFEHLHAWQSGIMKDGMRLLFLLGDLPSSFIKWYKTRRGDRPPVTKMTDSQLYINKPKFEAIFRFLTMYARRQSDREVPRTPFRNGVTDLTRLNGQEYPGLVMLTLVALKVLLPDRVPLFKRKEIILLFWRMLVLNDMMNLRENSERTLQLLDKRIVEFLALYKEVFGPTAEFSSNTGLRKVKFHAPKHASFYIRRYGSSDNFFGGSLESALKSTVKAPTKITSRRHDHLARDLANRQHERFVCGASLTATAKSIDDSPSDKVNMDSTQRRIRMRLSDDTPSVATEKPTGWELHSPVFNLTRQGDGPWSTNRGSYTHTGKLVYPNFLSKVDTDVFQDGEAEYVRKVAEYAREHGFQRVECSSGATIPSSRGQQRDVLRCHPSFHSYPYLRRPWYDWVMVKWQVDDDVAGDNEVLVAARLFLFARLSDNEDANRGPLVVAVIHSLSQFTPPPDQLLFFAKGDTWDEEGLTVIDSTAIAQTAFVLPCIENQGDEFPFSHEQANYFLVFPPRNEWIDIWSPQPH
jgi:hypothetical protein